MRRLLAVLILVAALSATALSFWSSLAPESAAQGTVASTEERPPFLMAQKGQSLPQPIQFSHKIHAGDNQIPCLYCHIGADKGPVATVPAVRTCMGCHKMVAAGKPEIQKLKQYWDNQQPIPWAKVYDLSDHVRFTHKRHVRAGIACQRCHGPVQEMSAIRLQQTLNMGFCVGCHKQHLNDKHTPASLDCSTCHK
jgi:predicted CXXCH cytochrome family protein